MTEIKKTVIEFCKAEARAFYLVLKPNINEYNIAFDKMHTYTVDQLKGFLGLIKLKRLKSDFFMK